MSLAFALPFPKVCVTQEKRGLRKQHTSQPPWPVLFKRLQNLLQFLTPNSKQPLGKWPQNMQCPAREEDGGGAKLPTGNSAGTCVYPGQRKREHTLGTTAHSFIYGLILSDVQTEASPTF